MSETQCSLRVESVKQEMNVFLGLLQKSISSSRDNILIETDSQSSGSCKESKRLSVIFSASEGASEGASSEQAKKENIYDDVSMNEFGSNSLEDNFIRPLIKKKTQDVLKDCTPSTTGKQVDFDGTQDFFKGNRSEIFGEDVWCMDKKNEQELLEYFKGVVKDYTNYISVLQKRNNENLIKQEKYRTKCEHLFRAFVTGREQQKRLLKEYLAQKQRIQKLEQLKGESELMRLKTQKDLELSKSENLYLKELIFIANKNYENLEKKYLESESRFVYSQIAMKQKQIHYMEGNSVLKDVIVNLGKQKRDKSADKSVQKSTQKERQKSKSKSKQKQNRPLNKHKVSKSVPPLQKPHCEDIQDKHEQLDDAYRRMFIKTLRGN